MENTDLSIIVINYNTKDLLKQCLDSLFNCSIVKLLQNRLEIIVVDNASTDGTIEEIQNKRDRAFGERSLLSQSEIKIIKNEKNLGFAAGNNRGIKEASGKYILLLNSDTIVFPDTLLSIYRYIDKHPEVGVVTCRVELPNGQLDPACHRGFPTPWASLTYFLGLERLFPKSRLFGRYHLGFLPRNKPHEIDSPSGAFYLVRREVIDKVGMLDEDYFMYGEDLDWSYRIKQAGWKIMYYPGVKIIHYKKQSGRAKEDEEVRKEVTGYFYETMKTFYEKHYRKKYPWIINTLIFLAIDIKKQINMMSNIPMILSTHVRGEYQRFKKL